MRFARYWIPAVAGFVLGSLLSLQLSGTPMRDLLSAARAETAGEPVTGRGESGSAIGSFGEDDRFARIFSALQEVRSLKRRSELHSAIGELAPGDLQALMGRIEALKGKLQSDDLVEVVLERWFEIAPTAAAAWIRDRPTMRSYQIFWAKTDPEAALNEVRRNSTLPCAAEMMKTAADTLAHGVLSEKARIILGLHNCPPRYQVLLGIAREWAAREPSEALDFAQNITDVESRRALMTSALGQWTRKDAEGAANEISARLSELENAREFPSLLTNTLSFLARKDVNRALDWIGSLPEQHRSESTYSAFAQAWADSQPIEALQWCVANNIDAAVSFPNSGRGSVVAAAMLSNPVETFTWIQSQPAGAMRDALLERALVSRGLPTNTRSDEIFQALQTLPGEARERAAAGIGRLVVANSPRASQTFPQWVERFQDPILRAATIAGAAEENSYHSTAKDFSNQFEEGPDRDAALRGLAITRIKQEDEQTAAATALKIGDQSLRWQTLDGFIVDWLRKDAKTAGQWLKSADSIPSDWTTAWQREADSAY